MCSPSHSVGFSSVHMLYQVVHGFLNVHTLFTLHFIINTHIFWTIYFLMIVIFFLQHHCRNCGEIFCNACSDNTMSLPSSAKPVRVCDDCHVFLVGRYSVVQWSEVKRSEAWPHHGLNYLFDFQWSSRFPPMCIAIQKAKIIAHNLESCFTEV